MLKLKGFATAVLALGGCLALLYTASAPHASAADDGAFVMKTCTRCHSARRICSMLGTRDIKAWESTIARMKGNGLVISDADAQRIAAHLAGLGRNTGAVCGK